jgi:hypothetical protein
VICGPPEDVEGVVVLQSGEKPFLDDLKSNMNVDDVAVSSEYIDAGSDDIPELRISLTSDTNGNSMDAVLKYQYDELKITSCFYNESYSDINIYAEDEVNLNGLNEFGILDSEGKYHTVYKYCHLYEDSNGIDYNQDIITVDENIEQIFGNEYGFKGWFTMVYQIGDQIYYVMDSWMYQTEEIREKYYELCNSTSIDQSMIIQEQDLNSIIAEEKKKY